MNLQKMALIAEVLGGIGIVVSILYLAYEVSQNSESMELSHHLTLSDQYLAVRQSVLENSELAKTIESGNSSISSLEPFARLQFEDYLTSIWDIWENAAYMSVTDRIDQQTWRNWDRALCLRMATPGSSEAWTSGLYKQFGDRFVQIANECYEKSSLPTASVEQ